MKLFGYEITVRKIRPEPRHTSLERLCSAVDSVNSAWAELRAVKGNSIGPWIVWADKEVVVTERKGTIDIIHSSN